MNESPEADSKTPIGEVVTTSCERCRRRKIKCDRRKPCARCRKAGTECMRAGTGEKQRPVPKTYARALEGQVASLEVFIRELAAADSEHRERMLLCYVATGEPTASQNEPEIIPSDPSASISQENSKSPQEDDEAGLARPRAGQLRKLAKGNSAHFYGGTSLFNIYICDRENHTSPCTDWSMTTTVADDILASANADQPSEITSPRNSCFQYAPHDDVSQRLMASFFREQYPYNMYIYREYFLRDYDVGTGRYYSDFLLFAICAMGSLATGDPEDIQLFDVFSAQAQQLLYSALDRPDLTSLQALLLLGQCEIGRGRASKGWLFCGMAFRLAHEMGLHLDPNNWNGTSEPDVDREILRRAYWAAFIVDKQLSLYFGRPPALYLYESDVRNTVRLPYPPDWEGLLDTYIAPGLSVTAFEDGIALVGALIHQAELSKIQHSIITELFENRRSRTHNANTAATVQKIHVSLTKWLASLPGKLYWNQWTVGQVPACVLHLHMRFHTAMIILHRPPRHLLSQPDVASSEDVEICYESLQAILRLLRSYNRFYRYDCLPIDFVHTLATAAGTIMMRHYLEGTPWDETQTSQALTRILEAMNAVQNAWPCVGEIKDSIIQASRREEGDIPGADALADFTLMTGLSGPVAGSDVDKMLLSEGGMFDADAGLLVTDDFLGGTFPWIAGE
ncbi:putative transcriptional regulatory protein [Colletotrichum fructicola]|nr:putative transcriptional regulatory protein [Colletotrichum fructicola]KAE9582188.1 putative transcriptional regulatory protein [Colletotrichum fructicola]